MDTPSRFKDLCLLIAWVFNFAFNSSGSSSASSSTWSPDNFSSNCWSPMKRMMPLARSLALMILNISGVTALCSIHSTYACNHWSCATSVLIGDRWLDLNSSWSWKWSMWFFKKLRLGGDDKRSIKIEQNLSASESRRKNFWIPLIAVFWWIWCMSSSGMLWYKSNTPSTVKRSQCAGMGICQNGARWPG